MLKRYVYVLRNNGTRSAAFSRGDADKFHVLRGTPFFIIPYRYTNQFSGT